MLQRNVLNELSKQILSGRVSKDSALVLDSFDGKVIFRNVEARFIAALQNPPQKNSGRVLHVYLFFRIAAMRKQQVLDSIAELPDEFMAEDLIERIIFMEKVERGLKDAREGRTISINEARTRLAEKWQK